MIVPTLTFIYDRKKEAAKNKPASVELLVYANYKKKYISTGVKLLPKEWSKGEVVACRPDYNELNELLQTFKKKVMEIVMQMIEREALDLNALPNLIKERMSVNQTFLEYCEEVALRKVRNLSDGTRKRYDVVLKFLKEWGVMTYFTDVTEKNIIKMDDYLLDRGLKDGSRYNYHKILKIITRQATEDGLIPKNPYSRLKIKRGDESGLSRCLTPKEFFKFESCDICIESLRKVRDLFVFQTYTMMSYSDLAEFRWKDCTKVDGQIVYKAKRTKTKQEFVIVLLPKALEILKKYRNRLPIISNVKYNLYLKSAVTYAGIDKRVSSHWARHTGATLMVNDGIPMHVVQHILGHATIRETEKTYAKVLDSTIIKGMASYGIKKGRG